MKISILLNNVTQEQGGERDDVAFVGWLHMPGAGPDGQLQGGDRGGKFGTRALPLLSLRKEAWGGVLVHGPTMIVFQVDHEAYDLFKQLIDGAVLDDLLKNTACTPTEIEEFKNFLVTHDLG